MGQNDREADTIGLVEHLSSTEYLSHSGFIFKATSVMSSHCAMGIARWVAEGRTQLHISVISIELAWRAKRRPLQASIRSFNLINPAKRVAVSVTVSWLCRREARKR